MFEGSTKEQEARLDYVLRQRRIAKIAAYKNKRLGFDDPLRLFLKKMHYLNPQSYGARIESYYKEKIGLIDVSRYDDRGDSKNKHGGFFEIKVSYFDINNTCNFIQLRPWHNVAGYLLIIIDSEKNYEQFYMYLTKEQMLHEIDIIGNLAHGTKSNTVDNFHKEYKIQLDANKSNWNRWRECYMVPNFKTIRTLIRGIRV